MRIGIMGTGGVGRTLAGALSEREHEVVMGSRDPEAALASTDVNQQTDTTLSGWHGSNTAVRVATFAEAAAHGDVLMLATAGNGSLAATAAAGYDLLDGKVLIDISNPLSWSDQG
ncbi:MAG: NAD(P)-binding domain-containing protein, partial [Actinomycetota bacterium]